MGEEGVIGMGWSLVTMVLVGVLALLFGRGPLRWMFLAFIFGFWVLPILAFLPSRRFKYPGEAASLIEYFQVRSMRRALAKVDSVADLLRA